MHAYKMNITLTKQCKRESAHVLIDAQQCYPERTSFAKVRTVAGRSSICSAAISLYRYPSPGRPAYSPSRPIPDFRLSEADKTADIGYHGEFAIHQRADRANSGTAEITTTIGSRLCKRHQSSLRQWQYLVWQVASTMTWSVASLAQVPALWLQRCWAQTALVQHWQAPQQASSVTTSAFAAKIDNRALAGRTAFLNRRRENLPTAVFSFLGT